MHWTRCIDKDPPANMKLIIKHGDKIHGGTFAHKQGARYYFFIDACSKLQPRVGSMYFVLPDSMVSSNYIPPQISFDLQPPPKTVKAQEFPQFDLAKIQPTPKPKPEIPADFQIVDPRDPDEGTDEWYDRMLNGR